MPKGIEISGKSPFGTSSGVYEVKISISQSKPSNDSITSNSFNSLWKDDFHLRVSEGYFSEILGSDSNPIPDNVFDLLKKNNLTKKCIGGYFPVNYEIDDLEILKKLKKKNIKYLYP